MKNFLLVVCAVLSVFIISFSAQSAILSVDVQGLESLLPDGVGGYQIEFDITGDTSWFSWGVTVGTPDAGNSLVFDSAQGTSWVDYANPFFAPGVSLTGSTITILNQDTSFVNPLDNGGIFTISYPDDPTISLSLSFQEFVLTDLATVVDPMFTIPSDTNFGPGNNSLTFTPVPIPPTVLLLGAGLVGLVGIRRRVKS